MNLDATVLAHVAPDAAFTTTKIAAGEVTINGKPVQSAYAVQDSHARAVGHVVKASNEWYAVDRDGRCSMYMLKTRAEALATLRIMWAACMISTDDIAFTGLTAEDVRAGGAS